MWNFPNLLFAARRRRKVMVYANGKAEKLTDKASLAEVDDELHIDLSTSCNISSSTL
jgi:hypothetical protein